MSSSRGTRFLFLIPFALVSFIPTLVHARPDWIRLGYVQCSACHTQPVGGGTLLPYGREVLSSSTLIHTLTANGPSANTDGEEPRWRLGVQARGLLYTRPARGSRSARAEVVFMQGDVNVRWAARPWSSDLTVGYQPDERSGTGIFGRSIVLRQAILAHSEGQNLFTFGRDALPLGTLTDDHTSFIRTQWRRSVTDYPTQLRWSRTTESLVTTATIFAPSFEETASDREYGATARAELQVSDSAVLGAFALGGQTTAIRRLGGGIFSRLGFLERGALFAELNTLNRGFVESPETTSTQQWIFFAEPSWALREWLDGFGRVEVLNLSNDPISTQLGLGARVRVVAQFLTQLELRATTTNDVSQTMFLWQWIGKI